MDRDLYLIEYNTDSFRSYCGSYYYFYLVSPNKDTSSIVNFLDTFGHKREDYLNIRYKGVLNLEIKMDAECLKKSVQDYYLFLKRIRFEKAFNPRSYTDSLKSSIKFCMDFLYEYLLLCLENKVNYNVECVEYIYYINMKGLHKRKISYNSKDVE